MSEARLLKSFELTDAAIKHVLTLATGTIGGAIALLDDDKTPGIQFGESATCIQVGLWLLVICQVMGLLAAHTVAGILAKPPAAIDKGSLRLFWGLQLIFFAVGFGVLVAGAL